MREITCRKCNTKYLVVGKSRIVKGLVDTNDFNHVVYHQDGDTIDQACVLEKYILDDNGNVIDVECKTYFYKDKNEIKII